MAYFSDYAQDKKYGQKKIQTAHFLAGLFLSQKTSIKKN